MFNNMPKPINGSGGGGLIKASGMIHCSTAGESIVIDTGLGNSLQTFCMFGLSYNTNTSFTDTVHFGEFALWDSSQAGYQNGAVTVGGNVAAGHCNTLGTVGDLRAATVMDVTNGVVTVKAALNTYGQFMEGADFYWVAM